MIETDGVTMCVHYRCLKADRPVPLVTKHEDEKEADPSTQKVQDNDFVVGADPGEYEYHNQRSTQACGRWH